MDDPTTTHPQKRRLSILLNEENSGNLDELALLKTQLEATGCEVAFEDEKAFMARGRVPDCDCNLIQCVCEEARTHQLGCQQRLALTCAVAIACEKHGYDVCPECDPCTCPKTP